MHNTQAEDRQQQHDEYITWEHEIDNKNRCCSLNKSVRDGSICSNGIDEDIIRITTILKLTSLKSKLLYL